MTKRPHSWVFWAGIGYQVCQRCGLVRLRNVVSQAAARATCRWWDD